MRIANDAEKMVLDRVELDSSFQLASKSQSLLLVVYFGQVKSWVYSV